jgi:lipoyl(octanoyl) transferase
MQNTKFIDLGLVEYKEAWDYQEKLVDKVIANRDNKDRCNYLIFCEHPHVYTLGKSGAPNNLLINDDFLKKINASFHKTNRGGDITYHGPGQIVAYPIFDLTNMKLGIKNYVYNIEEAVILSLKEFGIDATRLDGATGVWLDADKPTARKICAIGVRVTKFVTMHGLAFNINTDLSYFNYINPCGFIDKGVTSLKNENQNKDIDFEQAKELLKKKFIKVFNLELF